MSHVVGVHETLTKLKNGAHSIQLIFFYICSFINQNYIKMKKIFFIIALAFSFASVFSQGVENTVFIEPQEKVFTISCNFP
jgi:hypothetical protein